METPETIGRWVEETFPGGDPTSPRKALRLLEEVVELCYACGASDLDILDAVDLIVDTNEIRSNPMNVASEAADCYIVLCGFAKLRGFNLEAEADRKMAINRARRWRTLGDGTGYHVKD